MTWPDWCPQDVWEAARTANPFEGPRLVEAYARAILAERERCARVIEENMLCGDDHVFEESLLPRRLNPSNKVGLAYAAVIRGTL